MGTVRLNQHSRLRFSEFLIIEQVEFWDRVEFPAVPEQPDDIVYQVKSTDRMDLIAYRFYGDPAYAWVIAVANGMELVEAEFEVGLVLRIPSPRFVRDLLFRTAKV